MAVKKLASGKWQCQVFPQGRDGRRIRKLFATKGEALAFENYVKNSTNDTPWTGEINTDTRTLSRLVNIWYDSHGTTLDDGKRRKDAMHHFCECIGDPLAVDFRGRDFTQYRQARLKGKFARSERVPIVAPRTLNLELAYLRAMFNELVRLDEWTGENPVKNIRPFKTEEQEMAFLDREQIKQLFIECENSKARDLLTVVKICLSTGARWSEAESLKSRQVKKYSVTFTKTKGNKNRTIPINPDLYDELPKTRGNLFIGCYDAFRSALGRTQIELPDGQLTHVLRHTFASHFMMNGGNILVLQRILGHTDIKMTMRYAHFSPSHLEEATLFNPLAENGSKMAAPAIDGHS